MYFITIKNQTGETVAINPKRITSITNYHGHVIICLGSQENIYTQFTTIQAAVDYVERSYAGRSQHLHAINWEDDL